LLQLIYRLPSFLQTSTVFNNQNIALRLGLKRQNRST